MNIITSFKDLFHLSVVFMPNAFDICHHSLMLHARETFCQALVQSANKYNACCCIWFAIIIMTVTQSATVISYAQSYVKLRRIKLQLYKLPN